MERIRYRLRLLRCTSHSVRQMFGRVFPVSGMLVMLALKSIARERGLIFENCPVVLSGISIFTRGRRARISARRYARVVSFCCFQSRRNRIFKTVIVKKT